MPSPRKYQEVLEAVKVVEKERSRGFTYTDEFWADGVRPKGLEPLAVTERK